jgi:aminobenzoyl-glutamate utilization protein B
MDRDDALLASVSSAVLEEWEVLEPEIVQLFRAQWEDPELPAMEFRSAARLADWLAGHGFAVEKQVGGLPTAFVARCGNGSGPILALLAEFDALPGLDNDALPSLRPLGKPAGHGCGHNHIGPANAGAAIAAAKACRRLGLAGEIRLIGCPAEELLWGKIALLRAGIFSDIDGILTSHGDYQTGALSRPCQSVVSGEFVFTGESGHGGQAGQRNVLLIAEEMVAAASCLFKERYPELLLRHVLRQAGVMPSITPSETRVWFSARGIDYDKVRSSYDDIVLMSQDLAREGRVACRHQFISESRGYLPNDILGRVLHAAYLQAGPPKWSQDDLSFMEELSRVCSPDEQMELDRDVRYFSSGADYYGQDDGEVSWRVPLGRVNWAYPKQVPIHHWAWTALSGHQASYAGPLSASKAIALATVALLAEPHTVQAARDELMFRCRGQQLTEPRIGAMETLSRNPAAFWAGTWVE